MRANGLHLALALILALLSGACATTTSPPPDTEPETTAEPSPPVTPGFVTGTAPAPAAPVPPPVVRPESPERVTGAVEELQPNIRRGTGVFVRERPRPDGLASPYVINLATYQEPYDLDTVPDRTVYRTNRVYNTPYVKAGQTLYRLRLGFFDSRPATAALLRDIERDFPGAWIDLASMNERRLFAAREAVPDEPAADNQVTLNFEQASMREFVRVIFEDILGENYMIDPKVTGEVTLHTTYPVTHEAVLPIVETVLHLNGAALIADHSMYRILPLASAEGESIPPRVGRRLRDQEYGFGVQVVPLRHVGATQVEKILKTFLNEGETLRIDETRNLLILSGPRYRLQQLLETVQIFDVDWLAGISFGMFPLRYADATTLVGELENVVGAGGESPLAGMVRLIPVERLNGVLVIANQPRYLDQLRDLIEQFDWGTAGAPGRRLYVYYLQNGEAGHLAGMLSELFGEPDEPQREPGAGAIPRQRPGQGVGAFRTANEVSQPPPPVGTAGAGGHYPPAVAATGATPGTAGAPPAAPGEAGVAVGAVSGISIIADEDNNALLIMASPEDYRGIEAAIRKLDIPPRQVLINATIAEVTLTNNLDYGVRWFLQGNRHELAFNTPLPGGAGGDGLSLALFNDTDNVRMFFDLLESESSVKFISTPQVLVRDNQSASINVGDQIPVTVRTTQGIVSPDAPIVTEVQFRSTGTLLSVTPRINAGGMVTLDISQEVSLPGTEPAVGGGGNVSIAQRSINSSVTVQSGQTVVMGGLIRESRTEGEAGIPILRDLPVLGHLFSNTTEDINRTELIISISPLVIEDQDVLLQVTEELRERMKRATAVERAETLAPRRITW